MRHWFIALFTVLLFTGTAFADVFIGQPALLTKEGLKEYLDEIEVSLEIPFMNTEAIDAATVRVRLSETEYTWHGTLEFGRPKVSIDLAGGFASFARGVDVDIEVLQAGQIIARKQVQNLKLNAIPALAPLSFGEGITPFGPLPIIDEIDLAEPTEKYCYEEGGQFIYVGPCLGEQVRFAKGANAWFGYRLGRGYLEEKPYLIEVVYPEDVPRAYLMALLDVGGAQTGGHLAFHTGVYQTEDERTYTPENRQEFPLSGGFSSYWIIAWPQVGFHHKGPLSNGIWLYFLNKGNDPTNNGIAVKTLRLYDLPDYDVLFDPLLDDLRTSSERMHIWTVEGPRYSWETEIVKARTYGANAISPNLIPWNTYPSASFLGLRDLLRIAAEHQMAVIPRIEYGGSTNIPAEALAITPFGVSYKEVYHRVGGHGSGYYHAVNILEQAAVDDLIHVIETLFNAAEEYKEQIKGIYLRNRLGYLAPSFGDRDLLRYEQETGNQIPGDTFDEKRATLAAELSLPFDQPGFSVGAAAQHPYMLWWYEKLAEFLQQIADYLQQYDAKLYYSPFSSEGMATKGERSPLTWLTEREWGMNPAAFRELENVFVLVPIDQAWNAGEPAYVSACATKDGVAVSVGPMYIEYNWDGFPYARIAPSFEHGGPAYSHLSEVLALAAGDPVVLYREAYTSIHRGFPQQWKEFLCQYYLLPVGESTVLTTEPGVTLRLYPSGKLAVINTTLSSVQLDLSEKWPHLQDRITGERVDPENMSLAPLSLQVYVVPQGR
ncbi:MAG TPA: hypothetical protein GXX57_06730 [Firmicutes bacterium]|nr:hypothetical protein [Bacillota bacterium]